MHFARYGMVDVSYSRLADTARMIRLPVQEAQLLVERARQSLFLKIRMLA